MTYPISINKISESRISEIDFENIIFGRIYSDHMFTVDYKNGEWQEANILPYQPISLSPATSAIHYGQSIFEGMKAHKSDAGEALLFRPGKNFKRFNLSAQRMAMPEVPEELFMSAIIELLKIDKSWIPSQSGSSLYIRPFMFATDEFIGVKPSETFKFMIFTCPVGPYYPKPVKVKAAEKYVRAFKGGTGTAKAAGNYAATMQPVREAMEKGYQQILWLDGKDFKKVQEIGTMNVFFVIDGKVITPELDGSILEGVTRDSSIQLLKNKGYDVEERVVEIDEIYNAYKAGKLDDAFGTGTAATIAQISDIGYKGENIELPSVDERIISNELKQELEGIKRLQKEDKFNWVVKLPAGRMVGRGRMTG